MHTQMVTLGHALTSLLASKERANFRANYIRCLRQYLTLFIQGRESDSVTSIDLVTVENWFITRKEKPSTQRSNIGRLSALFTHCWRHKWISENPCNFIEKPRVDHRSPQIFTLRQCMRILVWTRRNRSDALAIVVLGLLCGLRPEESEQITWADIDLTSGAIRIDAIVSKVRQRRIVKPMPSAIAWLRHAKQIGAALPVKHQRRRRFLRRLREYLRLRKWPQDILRHTCASYWLAEWQDAGKIAHELGNSAGILLRHYRELVTREKAAEFWSIIPKDFKEAACRTFPARIKTAA